MVQHTPFFATITLLAALGAAPAHALEYNRPDPPGALSFDTIALRTVPVPNEKIPANCDSAYRAGMESSFAKIWRQCQQAGLSPPSDCQRALFSRCTELAADFQKMEAQACVAMAGESDAIQAFKAVDNQKTAQASTADLNARAYVATQRVIAGLRKSSQAIDAHRRAAVGTLNAGACAQSTEATRYGKVESVVTGALGTAQAHLQSTIQSRQTAAAQFAKNSGQSAANLAQLVSAAPVKGALAAPATAGVSTIRTGTVVETVISTAPPTATVITTSTTTSTPVTAFTVTGTTPITLQPVPYIPPESSSGVPKWVPIVAIGVPAAILTALVVSKLSKNGIGAGAPGGDTGAAGDGGGTTGSDDGSRLPGDGNRNPSPSAVPGGGDLAAWKITVDPSFTDQQKAIVAASLTKIPACYRYKLQGLYVENKVLEKVPGGCVAGKFFFGGNTVYLSPSCTMAIGVTVHEFFHVIGNRNGNAVHQQWKPVSDQHPNCPVTPYGKTNFYEDFAESGRLLEYPDSSAETKNSGACVDAKIQGLGQIMNSCPN